MNDKIIELLQLKEIDPLYPEMFLQGVKSYEMPNGIFVAMWDFANSKRDRMVNFFAIQKVGEKKYWLKWRAPEELCFDKESFTIFTDQMISKITRMAGANP